jgi:Tfp pilus assembly protein PilO
VKIKNRQKLLVIVAVTAVGLFVADKIVLGPLGDAWTARSKEIEKLQKKVDDGRQLVKRRDSLTRKWSEMRTNALPNNTSMAEQTLLRAFDRWAQRSSLTLTSLSPQWKHDSEDYVTLDCRVEASGNLDRISRFLYELESDPLAVKLESLEISARDTDGQQLALGVQVSALVLVPESQRP